MFKLLKKIFTDEKQVREFEIPVLDETKKVDYKEENLKRQEVEPFKNQVVSPILGLEEELDPMKSFYTKVDEHYKERNRSLQEDASLEEKYKGFVGGNREYYLNQLDEEERAKVKLAPTAEPKKIKEVKPVEAPIEESFDTSYFGEVKDEEKLINLDDLEIVDEAYSYTKEDIEEETEEYTEEIVKEEKEIVDDVFTPKKEEKKDLSDIKEPTKRKTKAYKLPSLSLLDKPSKVNQDDLTYLDDMKLIINSTLEQFQIQGQVVNYTNGPSVTQFEVQLAPGVKVNRITGIEDNLKMNLASVNVRIEAPIPGKTTIGIEVPNKVRRTVDFSSILTKDFIENTKPLNVALGLDIGGKVVSGDIAKMPHGLIAGATGSGKSVCLDTILMSLIMKNTPDDLKMILIDPKVVGLANYKDIPHLCTPIIKEATLAKEALNWAVEEMERRYALLYNINAKDIISYNRKLSEKPEYAEMQKMPYLLVVIEEMADLMNVVGSEVEESIMRITQKARACGIHLLVATQRPSVDVIKGTIKSNIPTRIAMKVSSMSDSMTILDATGAEKLLGNGDMLFNFNGMGAIRAQGAYVKDEEIERVCDYWRTYPTDFLFTTESLIEKQEMLTKADSLDPYFYEVARFVIEQNYASINGVQKQFGVGFNRASSIFDQLEQEGIITPKNSKNPRKVVMTLEEFTNNYEEN